LIIFCLTWALKLQQSADCVGNQSKIPCTKSWLNATCLITVGTTWFTGRSMADLCCLSVPSCYVWILNTQIIQGCSCALSGFKKERERDHYLYPPSTLHLLFKPSQIWMCMQKLPCVTFIFSFNCNLFIFVWWTHLYKAPNFNLSSMVFCPPFVTIERNFVTFSDTKRSI
jgi:hypothetical protein